MIEKKREVEVEVIVNGVHILVDCRVHPGKWEKWDGGKSNDRVHKIDG